MAYRYGYYSMSAASGLAAQAAGIVASQADPSPLAVQTPDAQTLAGLDALVVWNDGGSLNAEFLAHLDDIRAAVQRGMSLIVHDRLASSASAWLPGAGAAIEFILSATPPGGAQIEISDDTGPLAAGPAGVLDDNSLDGGSASSHGYALAGSLPSAAEILLTRQNPDQVVAFGYQYGTGHVYFSSIPIDFYATDSLRGNGLVPDALYDAMKVYEANLLAHAADHPRTREVDLGSTPEDVAGGFEITAALLLQHAADDDGLAGLTVRALRIDQGLGSLVAQAEPGTWRYIPAANDATEVSFRYEISDGKTATTGLARLDLSPVNDAPSSPQVALGRVAEGSGAFPITEAMLLGQASDIEGDRLSASALQLAPGSRGRLEQTGPGSWSFTPDPDDDGAVLFSFQIGDGQASTSATARLDITGSNDAPSLRTSQISLAPTDEDTPSEPFTVLGLLASAGWSDADTGAQKGLALAGATGSGHWEYSTGGGAWKRFDPPAEGTVLLLDAAAKLRYVPDGLDGETATLRFRAWDASSGSASTDTAPGLASPDSTGGGSAFSSTATTASLVVSAVNDAPATGPVSLKPILEDGAALEITQAMLLGQASDVDGPGPLQAVGLQIRSGRGSLVPAAGSPGSWLYTPAADDDTELAFSYGITDGRATVPGSATLDLLPVNDAPLARADEAQARIGSGLFIGVLANDADIDGGPLAVSAFSPAPNGSLSISADGQGLLYTPNPGFTGFDRFSYTVSDGAGGSATGSVRVLVASHLGTPGNDVPLGTPQADVIAAGDGHDRVLAHAGADYVDGGRGNDTLTGGAGADTLLGGDGHDTFIASAADLAGDSIDGGDGIDTLLITDAIAFLPASFTLESVEQLSFPGALMVAHSTWLDLSALSLAGSGNQIIGGAAASRIIGTRSNDRITDTAGHDDLRGAEGHDTLIAGTGQDTLYGGPGNDTLVGGFLTMGDGLRDTFVFNTALNAATNVDTILGFEANGRDVIALDSAVFAAIGPTLEASEFRSAIGGLANDANDYILFDPATGALYYDPDGSGAAPRTPFATLGAGLTGTVDFSDFTVGGFGG